MLSSGPAVSFRLLLERQECWESLLPCLVSPLAQPTHAAHWHRWRRIDESLSSQLFVLCRDEEFMIEKSLSTSKLRLSGGVALCENISLSLSPIQEKTIRIAFNLSQSCSIRKGFVYIESRLPIDSLHHRLLTFHNLAKNTRFDCSPASPFNKLFKSLVAGRLSSENSRPERSDSSEI